MQPRIALIDLIVKIAIWLIIPIAIILTLTALRVIPSERRWFLKCCFALATVIPLSFVVAFWEAVQHYGGFGLSPSGFIAISVLSVETGILGVVAFRTPFRLLPLVFTATGLVVILRFVFRRF